MPVIPNTGVCEFLFFEWILSIVFFAVSGKVTAVSDSIVTIDNTIICNFNIPDASIKSDQSVSIKGRLVGFDDLMGELKLDQCSIYKNN